MIHREWMTLILGLLAFVLFVGGAASLAMLPRVLNIVLGVGLFAAAVILGFVSLEFLPRDEEERP